MFDIEVRKIFCQLMSNTNEVRIVCLHLHLKYAKWIQNVPIIFWRLRFIKKFVIM